MVRKIDHLNRNLLCVKAVHIQCLDANKKPVNNTNASGFIVREKDQLFLYTCWHVVTGYDMHNLEVRDLPNRRFLKVSFLQSETSSGAQVIGWHEPFIIPLYDTHDDFKPLWEQEKEDVPQSDLNRINIRVPRRHDAIKIQIPNDVSISRIHIIEENHLRLAFPPLGEKLYVVGFPYGYSAFGIGSSIAILLTRFIATTGMENRGNEFLLDGPCAPGMSGSPVFVEQDNRIQLTGLYTGLIYPDHVIKRNEKTTALGTCCQLISWWKQLKSG